MMAYEIGSGENPLDSYPEHWKDRKYTPMQQIFLQHGWRPPDAVEEARRDVVGEIVGKLLEGPVDTTTTAEIAAYIANNWLMPAAPRGTDEEVE